MAGVGLHSPDRTVYTGITVCHALFMTERLVLIPEVVLNDTCALVERAAIRLHTQSDGRPDALIYALRGNARELRTHSVLDPCQ